MPGRNINPDVSRKSFLINRWRESGQRGRLYWKAQGNWRWKNWHNMEVARIVDNGQLIQRFYSLNEVDEYLDGGATEPMPTVKQRRK